MMGRPANRALDAYLRDVSVMYELVSGIGRSLDLQAELDRFLEGVMARFGYDVGAIVLSSEAGGPYRVASARGFFRADELVGRELPGEEYGLAEVVRTGQPLVRNVLEEADAQRIILPHLRARIRSYAFLPIPFEDSVLGVLRLFSYREHAFPARTLKMIASLLDRLGVAVHHALTVDRLRRAEASLRESAEWFATTLRSIGDAVIATDDEGRVLFMNPTAEELTGWKTAEAIGQDIRAVFRIVNEDTRREVESPVAKVIREGLVVGLANHTLLIARDGTERPIDDSGAPIKDEEGNLRGVVLVFHDISARRQAEKALAESEERYRRLVELLPDGVAVHSEGVIVYANQAAARLLGAAGPEELIGRPVLSFVHPDYVELVRERIRAAQEQGRRLELVEEKFLRLDGEAVDVEVAAAGIVYRDRPAGLVVVRDVSERMRFQQQLEFLADHDAFTGLYNRRRFQKELKRQLVLARHCGQPGALLLLDLDNFKYVNKAFGQEVGDELLLRLSGLLQARLRQGDLLARLGGDEFGIFLHPAGAGEALAAAAQILRDLEGCAANVRGEKVGVSASVGIALFPEHGETVEELLARADLALHGAKEEGASRVQVYVPAMEQEARASLAWMSRLREALAGDRLILHLQPIFDLASLRPVAYEALVRLVGEGGELVYPDAFLGTAERGGLVQELDRWVVRRAIRLVAERRASGQALRLHVNLSGMSLVDAELLAAVERELAAGGVDPSDLVFEVTESAAATNIVQAQRFIGALRRLGCQFALDDFGTGFSSFAYLKHLPVDYLKIDGSFVASLPRDEADRHLVRAMVELARGLGKKTIAEFVGDGETVVLLRQLGVDYGQGFHLGRPAAVEQVLPPLRAG